VNDFPFLVRNRASMGYHNLARPDREALDRALERLAALPPERWPAAGAAPLKTPEPTYFLPVDKSLRAFVRPAEGGRLELLDLVRQETLDRYFGGGPLGNGTR
jgi:hypothetical protein